MIGTYEKPPTQIFVKLQSMTSNETCQMLKAIDIVDVSLACPEKVMAHVKSISQTQESKKGLDLTEGQKVLMECLMESDQ